MRGLNCMRAWRRCPESPVRVLSVYCNGASWRFTIHCTVTSHIMNRPPQHGNSDGAWGGHLAAIPAAADRRGFGRGTEL